MKLFKYRGGEFERDLKSIEEDSFWASKYDKLNDPCETFINTKTYNNQFKILSKLFGNKSHDEINLLKNQVQGIFDDRKKEMGIFSLSQTYKDELLWAHYADNHRGFCIEYNLELLLKSFEEYSEIYNFPIIYKKKPPKQKITDIKHTIRVDAVKKLAGYKSKRWNYEKEYRIVTGNYGAYHYNSNCFKSIYFGVNMEQSEKNKMIDTLKNKEIVFFEMVQKNNSYDFEACKIL